ncbi:MAG: hypothetical protein P8N63_09850 [Pseudomonadales bacterium]|nr:hypothetical protein [Pseudomonadales bacterium]
MPRIWRSRRRTAQSIIGRGTGLLMVAGLLMGIGPLDRVPGARLVGNVVDAPIASWRFVEKAGQCQLETRPQYPHSVTVNCWHVDGQLYIGCMHCQDKVWSHYVDQTQLARVKIASQVYPVILERTTNTQEVAFSWAARWDQLARERPVPEVPEHYWLYRVTTR